MSQVRKFDLLIHINDVGEFSRLVCELVKKFKTPDVIEEILNSEITEERLQCIKSAALMENQPLSFSFKQ